MNLKKMKLSLSAIITLLVVIVALLGCSKKRELITMDVGFNAHPIVGRGVYYDASSQNYQLYFSNNSLEEPQVYFFDLKGQKVDSLTINFSLKKNPNNIKFITKDSILYTIGNEDKNEFYLIDQNGTILKSKSLKSSIAQKKEGHEYYLVPFRNNCYTDFSIDRFATTILFSPSDAFKLANNHLSDAVQQKELSKMEKEAAVLLSVQSLFTNHTSIEFIKNLFDEKDTKITRAKVVDLKDSFYFYSPYGREMYEFDYNLKVLNKIQLLSDDIRIPGEEATEEKQKISYINYVLLDKNTPGFYVVVSIDNDNYDGVNIPSSTFEVIRFDENFEKRGSKVFDGEHYDINSVFLVKDTILVEKRSEIYGQVVYEKYIEN